MSCANYVCVCVCVQTKKIDKRKLPALRLRADEAVENLASFIKYKADERK